MPAGIHKGKRVVLTLDQETYDQWIEIAKAMGDLPVATAIRINLERTTPMLGKSIKDVQKALDNGTDLEDVMGRALWEVVKTMTMTGPEK